MAIAYLQDQASKARTHTGQKMSLMLDRLGAGHASTKAIQELIKVLAERVITNGELRIADTRP